MLQRVFVDADVLASRTPYDWLALLRDETDAFQLHSSPAVVADAVRLWHSRDPAAREAAIPRRIALVTASLDEVLAGADTVADPRVGRPEGGCAVAAARTTGAQLLLSSSAVPGEDGDGLPFEICTPDDFLCLTDDATPEAVREVTRRRVAEPLAAALAAADCPAFAERVTSHLRALSR
ncbi:hypothetical protein ACI3KY_09295 [Microbacterium sp. ZW T2_14]|uniref:hypothetical protein n=1 Tax=Microbacterium sp. ZW T2_14 TaxID=3378079 RepID=UPI003851D294